MSSMRRGQPNSIQPGTVALILVYATLKKKGIQEEVLGHEAHLFGYAVLRDYAETTVHLPDDVYPTLRKHPGASVAGEVFECSRTELDELDRWESNYRRLRIFPGSPIPTYTYVLRDDAGTHHELDETKQI